MVATMPDRPTTAEPTDLEIIAAAYNAASASTITTISVPSVDELQRVLTNALLCAGSDAQRPPLYAVNVEVRTEPERTDGTHGRTLEVVTTDSYRLMHQEPARWEVNGPDGSWLIDRDALAPVLALAKTIKGREREAPCVIEFGMPDDRGHAVCDFRGGIKVASVRLVDGNFPNWRQLVPGDEQFTGKGAETGLALNPRFVADLVKYRAPDRKAGDHNITLRAQDHLKPCIWKLSAEAWCLQMPVRTT